LVAVVVVVPVVVEFAVSELPPFVVPYQIADEDADSEGHDRDEGDQRPPVPRGPRLRIVRSFLVRTQPPWAR
jgi:hypothetical protein